MKQVPAYLLIFTLSAALFGSAALLSLMTWNVAECNSTDARPNTYIAECSTIGDYEHGALFYGLEPFAVKNLQQADALLLGDSHTQFSFSNPATDSFFASHGLRYFVLGFGYAETSDFIRALVDRYQLKPKILIINTDPFFTHKLGIPADQILGTRAPMTRVEYQFKHAAIGLNSELCRVTLVSCGGPVPAIYRSRTNGQWLLSSIRTGKTIPVPGTGDPAPAALVEQTAAIGRQFLQNIKIDPSCVVLTGIPGREDDRDAASLAAQLADRLGTKVLNIAVPDMETIDGSHMNPDTVRRWSESFFDRLPAVLGDCPALTGTAQAHSEVKAHLRNLER